MRKIHLHPCGNFRERYDRELTVFSTDFGRLWAGIGLMILFAFVPLLASPILLAIPSVWPIEGDLLLGGIAGLVVILMFWTTLLWSGPDRAKFQGYLAHSARALLRRLLLAR